MPSDERVCGLLYVFLTESSPLMDSDRPVRRHVWNALRTHAGWAISFLIVVLLGASSVRTSAQPDTQSWDLAFTTRLDGQGTDAATALAMDEAGNLYVAGSTASADFPTVAALFGFQGGSVLGMDLFVAKLGPDGTPRFTTVLGGRGEDIASAIALAPDGGILVAGSTTSNDFPVTDGSPAFQGGGTFGSDAFLLRLRNDGTGLGYATYLGGNDDDTITHLAVDTDGSIYVGGGTYSTDLPVTANAVQSERAGAPGRTADAFLARFRPEPSGRPVLEYLTYLGGQFDDIATALAVASAGGVWIAGATNSDDFPTRAPLQDTFAGPMRDREGDAWLAHVRPESGTLSFSSYFGGARDDKPVAVIAHAAGGLDLVGTTASVDVPGAEGPTQPARRGTANVFTTRLSSTDETAALRSTHYVGGGGDDVVAGSGVGTTSGTVWVAGATRSDDFPVLHGYAELAGAGQDAFVTKIDLATGQPQVSVRLGGDADDAATAVAARDDRVCIAGGTLSPAFPGIEAAGPAAEASFVSCLSPSADGPAAIPPRLVLEGNYPNPFRQTTTLPFVLPGPAEVRLAVYDLLGRRIATLIDEQLPAGRHHVPFRASGLASGLYFYVLDAGGRRISRSMVIVH